MLQHCLKSKHLSRDYGECVGIYFIIFSLIVLNIILCIAVIYIVDKPRVGHARGRGGSNSVSEPVGVTRLVGDEMFIGDGVVEGNTPFSRPSPDPADHSKTYSHITLLCLKNI